MALISSAIAISSASQKSSGNRASRSRESTAINRFGGMCSAKMRMLPTRWRGALLVCARYPGCVLLFERLRKIKPKGGSKSRRMNRRQANQLRGKINQYARDKAYTQGVVTAEVNPHG